MTSSIPEIIERIERMEKALDNVELSMRSEFRYYPAMRRMSELFMHVQKDNLKLIREVVALVTPDESAV